MMNLRKDMPKINLVIDVIMLVLLMAIAGLGFLIKYVLIPGYKRNTLYQGDVELYFMGLTRHEWGSIHLWLSYVFLALMILHIVLHWKTITCIFKQMVTKKVSRTFIALGTGTIAIFFALAPFFVKPVVAPFQAKHHHNFTDEKSLVESASSNKFENLNSDTIDQTTDMFHKNREEHNNRHSHVEPEIYGSMTLEDVSLKYSIPSTELTKALNIPLSASSEKIGRIKKMYGFEMEELKNAVIKLKDKH